MMMKSTSFIFFLYAIHVIIATDRFAAISNDDRHNPNVPVRNNPTNRPSQRRTTRKPTARKPVIPSPSKPTFAPTNRPKFPTRMPVNTLSSSKKPNALPTPIPSKKPIAPTSLPTNKQRAPTKKPITSTGKPVILNWRVPTSTPSINARAPSKKPASFLTGVPFSSPVSWPISSPSDQIKTLKPSSMPASTGSNSCKSEAGNFGQVTSNAMIVTYNYRMDLAMANPGPVLQSLEVAISDTLVKSLVSSCSRSPSNLFISKATTGSNSSQVLGMVSAPLDKVISILKCPSSASAAATNCFLIEGKMTIYLSMIRQRRHLSSTEIYGKASSAIQDGMSSGSLVQSNIAIVKLTYLNDGTITTTGTNNSTSLPPLTGSSNDVVTVTINKNGTKNDPSVTPVAWALIGVFGGIFTIAILALTYLKLRNKNKRRQDHDESKSPQLIRNDTLDDSTIISSSTNRPRNGKPMSLSDAEERRRKARSWG